MASQVYNLLFNIEAKDKNLATTTNNATTSLKGMGTAAQGAGTSAQTASTGLNSAANASGQVQTKGNAASQAMGSLKASFSNMGTKLVGFGLGIAGVAAQIAGISDAYDSLKDTELTLATQRTKLKNYTTSITTAEHNLAKMRKEGKENTVEYKDAEAKLLGMKDKQTNMTNNLNDAEGDYQRAQRAFYIGLAPQIIGIGSQIGSTMLIMKQNAAGAATGLGSMSKGAKLLTGALKILPLAAIGAAIWAIRNNVGGFRDMLDSLGKKIGEMLPGLAPFLTWIRDLAAAFGLTGGPLDMAKAFELLKTGFQGALQTIMTTDWTKVLTDMFNNIGNFFANADWVVLWKKFREALYNGGKWIADELTKLWNKFTNWFNTTNWAEVWKRFQDAIVGGATWVGARLGEVWDAIVKWAVSVDWLGLWKRFQDALVAGGTWVKDRLTDVWDAIIKWVTSQDWLKIWQRFQDAIVAGATWVGAKLGEIWDALVKWVVSQDWLKIWQRFQDAIFGAGKWITEKLGQAKDAIVKWFVSVDWLSVWKRFQDALYAGGKWILERLGDAKDAIVKWATSVDWLAVWKRFQDAMYAGGMWLSDTWTKIQKYINDNWSWEWFTKTMSGLVDYLYKGFQTAIAQLSPKMTSLSVDWIDPFFDMILNQAVAFFTEAVPNFVQRTFTAENFIKGINAVVDFGKTIFQKIIDLIFSKPDPEAIKTGIANTASGINDAIGNWFETNFPKLTATMKKIVENLGKAVNNAGSAFGTMVNNFWDMLTKGIAALPAKALDAAKGLLQAIADGIGKAGDVIGAAIWEKLPDWLKSAINWLTGKGATPKVVPNNPPRGVQKQAAGETPFYRKPGTEVNEWGQPVNQKPPITGSEAIVIPAPDLRLFQAGLMAAAEAYVYFVNQVNSAKLTLTALITKPFDDALIKTATAFVYFVNQVKAAKITFPAPITTAFDNALLKTAQAFVYMANKITATKILISINNTTAIQLIDAVLKRWQSAASTIPGIKPALSANNTSAIAIIDAVVKRWQSAKPTIESIKPVITVNNSSALSAIDKVVQGLAKIKDKSVTVRVGLSGAGAQYIDVRQPITDMRGPLMQAATTPVTSGTMTLVMNLSGNEIVDSKKLIKEVEYKIGQNLRSMPT